MIVVSISIYRVVEFDITLHHYHLLYLAPPILAPPTQFLVRYFREISCKVFENYLFLF